MIIYRCGRAVKDINDLEEGKLYCFYDFGGTLKIECGNYIFRAGKEGVVLVLDADAVKDRIKNQRLWKCYAENKARKKTEEMIFNK